MPRMLYFILVLTLLTLRCCALRQTGGRFALPRLLASSDSSSSSPSQQDGVVEARLIVSGASVQGPYYRTILKHEATMMRKLKGSLYEREDGKSSEVIVQGSKSRVASFVKWVEKGPPLALRDPVTLVSVQYRDTPSPDLGPFEIKKIRKP